MTLVGRSSGTVDLDQVRADISLLEGIPAIVLFGPPLFPIAARIGVNEVHYAMIAILAMGIGLFAPPFRAGMGRGGTVDLHRFPVELERVIIQSTSLLRTICCERSCASERGTLRPDA